MGEVIDERGLVIFYWNIYYKSFVGGDVNENFNIVELCG